ncbi:Alpha-1B adrenergic receptor [Trichoplax sp. H2]|nr:Alpha-1B adrenergic receptor [Trichoplax sp. H2]|eukprot:RDD39671.1 Alpha-1B adrenergic receptor [Trichoplax sp. H2]
MIALATKNETLAPNISSTFQIFQIVQRLFVLPAIVALVLNVCIIRSIFQSKDLLRSSTYRYIANMVFSDLATGIIFTVLPFISSFPLPYVIADIICRTLSYVTGVTYMASILSLVAISVDRYQTIVKSLSTHYQSKKLIISKRVIVLIWLISITFSIPLVYVTGVISEEDKSCAILNRGMSNLIYFFSITSLLYVVPLVAMLILYFKIYRYLVRRSRMNTISHSDISSSRNMTFLNNSKRKDLVKTLITITGAFGLMTWPFFAMASGTAVTGIDIRDLLRTNIFLFLLAAFAASSTVMTSVVNPILLICIDKNIGTRISIPMITKRHGSNSTLRDNGTSSFNRAKNNTVKPATKLST